MNRSPETGWKTMGSHHDHQPLEYSRCHGTCGAPSLWTPFLVCLAIGLFVSEEATLGQASAVAGLSQAPVLLELGRRRISIHDGADELAEDSAIEETAFE
jgi:hypothetical protein